ncbi:MAG: 2,3-bisphosphoglycerate-independent phosphoglycerate mutase [Candidatus Omnitrophota bacterium]|jgi:2,3-bisphosphoglycerate-independent phosphoglycerate mutase
MQKKIIFYACGIADEPLEAFDGKTPLEIAATPNLNKLSTTENLFAASLFDAKDSGDISQILLSLFGCDDIPSRGNIDSNGVTQGLANGDWVWSVQFITADDGKAIDLLTDQISPIEIKQLIQALNAQLKGMQAQFIATRHGGMILKTQAFDQTITELDRQIPSIDLINEDLYQQAIPSTSAGKKLNDILKAASAVLIEHDVNKVRIDLGENPANALWAYGPGIHQNKSAGESKTNYFKAKTVMVGPPGWWVALAQEMNIDFVQADAVCSQEEVDLVAYKESVAKALESHDVVLIAVDGADKASKRGDYRAKVRWIEAMDELLGQLMQSEHTIQFSLFSLCAVSSKQTIALPSPTPSLLNCQLNDIASDSIFSEEAAMQQKISLADLKSKFKEFIA